MTIDKRLGSIYFDMQQSEQKILYYFADPMCSWCYGFSPVLDAIKDAYADDIKVALVMGGLRPGSSELISDKLRNEILHHWHAVHARSGQLFKFEGAMPPGFIYDTEPASRAVVAVGDINPKQVLRYFAAVQTAFYLQQKNVTREEILIELAGQFDIDADSFKMTFNSAQVKNTTLAHFQKTQAFGVRGFPTVILQNKVGYTPLTSGYRPFSELKEKLDAWLTL